jgi:hypothetical protein
LPLSFRYSAVISSPFAARRRRANARTARCETAPTPAFRRTAGRMRDTKQERLRRYERRKKIALSSFRGNVATKQISKKKEGFLQYNDEYNNGKLYAKLDKITAFFPFQCKKHSALPL